MIRLKPTALLVPIAAIGALALGGCGGSSNAATSNTANVSAQKARVSFENCLRQHGVNIQQTGNGTATASGGGGAGIQVRVDRGSPAFQSAFTACRSYLRGAFGNITPAQRAQFRQQLVKFTACLRAHGQNVPDPTFSDTAPGAGPPAGRGPGGGERGVFSTVDRNSPAFQAAAKACQANLPKPPGGGNVRIGIGGPGPAGPKG